MLAFYFPLSGRGQPGLVSYFLIDIKSQGSNLIRCFLANEMKAFMRLIEGLQNDVSY